METGWVILLSQPQNGEKDMKKIIVSIDGCHKCKTLKELCPGLEYVTLKPEELVPFAQAVGIKEMPLVVISGGSPDEIKQAIGE